MQPQTLPKPVMDVAAPSKAPVPRPTPMSAAPVLQAHHTAAPLAVKPAPSQVEPIVEPSMAGSATAEDEADSAQEPAHEPKKAERSVPQGPHAPVVLITVTIFVMLVLAAFATIIYLSSKS